jgi:hypothetical protein
MELFLDFRRLIPVSKAMARAEEAIIAVCALPEVFKAFQKP